MFFRVILVFLLVKLSLSQNCDDSDILCVCLEPCNKTNYEQTLEDAIQNCVFGMIIYIEGGVYDYGNLGIQSSFSTGPCEIRPFDGSIVNLLSTNNLITMYNGMCVDGWVFNSHNGELWFTSLFIHLQCGANFLGVHFIGELYQHYSNLFWFSIVDQTSLPIIIDSCSFDRVTVNINLELALTSNDLVISNCEWIPPYTLEVRNSIPSDPGSVMIQRNYFPVDVRTNSTSTIYFFTFGGEGAEGVRGVVIENCVFDRIGDSKGPMVFLQGSDILFQNNLFVCSNNDLYERRFSLICNTQSCVNKLRFYNNIFVSCLDNGVQEFHYPLINTEENPVAEVMSSCEFSNNVFDNMNSLSEFNFQLIVQNSFGWTHSANKILPEIIFQNGITTKPFPYYDLTHDIAGFIFPTSPTTDFNNKIRGKAGDSRKLEDSITVGPFEYYCSGNFQGYECSNCSNFYFGPTCSLCPDNFNETCSGCEDVLNNPEDDCLPKAKESGFNLNIILVIVVAVSVVIIIFLLLLGCIVCLIIIVISKRKPMGNDNFEKVTELSEVKTQSVDVEDATK